MLFCDLRTDQLLDVLPVSGLQWEDWIGKAGTLRGQVDVPDEATAARCRRLYDGRTAVWVERDGSVVWGGVQWTSVRESRRATSAASWQIQASTWEDYLARRRLYDTLTGTGVDQLDIARQLVDYAQAQPGGDIGIEIDWVPTSGVLRDRTYSRYDLPRVRELLDQLAAVEDGFEWRVSSWRDDAGARHKSLVLGYPRITAGSADTVLDMPGPIAEYALPSDATGTATAWQSRGASINQNQAADSVPLMSTLFTWPDRIDDGWPRLDGSSDYTTVTDPATLDAHALADITRARDPELIPAVTINSGGRELPPLGGTVRLRIVDVWHPQGLDERYRVIGRRVTAAQAGTPERADLFLEVV